ncbi:wee1-like protein kinase-like protein, partial [Corchorus olitorius]
RVGGHHAVPVPGRCAGGAGGGGHAAAVDAGDLPADALRGPDRQPDEPGWTGHCSGHAGGCGGRCGGEHRDCHGACPRPQDRSSAARGRDPSRSGYRCSADALRRFHHRHRVPAAVVIAGAGGQVVRAGGADHRAGTGLVCGDRLYGRAGVGLHAAARACG